MEKPELAVIVGAIATIVTAIGTTAITKAYDLKSKKQGQEELDRLQNNLRSSSEALTACQVELKQCQIQRDQNAREKADLKVSGDDLGSELDQLTERLNAASTMGSAFEFDDNTEVSLRRSDWVAIPLAGRTVAIELDRVTDEGPIFRIGGCQDPPASEGLTLDDPRARPVPKLDRENRRAFPGLGGWEGPTLQM